MNSPPDLLFGDLHATSTTSWDINPGFVTPINPKLPGIAAYSSNRHLAAAPILRLEPGIELAGIARENIGESSQVRALSVGQPRRHCQMVLKNTQPPSGSSAGSAGDTRMRRARKLQYRTAHPPEMAAPSRVGRR